MKKSIFTLSGIIKLIAICLALNSCAAIQHKYSGKSYPITAANLNSISGYYQDFPSSDASFNSPKLWTQLTNGVYKNGRRDTEFVYKSGTPGFYQVNIKAIKQHKLDVRLYLDDRQIGKKKTVRGRVKNGCFCVRSTRVIPFFPLVFGYFTHSTRIGLIDKGLFVDSKWKDWGFAIIAGGSHNYVCSATYTKLK